MDRRAAGLLSAALRHARDAEHLVGSGHDGYSPDQAFHLAGFAPECARKATLSTRAFDQSIGHGVGALSATGLSIALSNDVQAHRYNLVSWATRYPALAKWSENCRYDATGAHAVEARAVVGEARDAVDRVAFALWADGHVPEQFEW